MEYALLFVNAFLKNEDRGSEEVLFPNAARVIVRYISSFLVPRSTEAAAATRTASGKSHSPSPAAPGAYRIPRAVPLRSRTDATPDAAWRDGARSRTPCD